MNMADPDDIDRLRDALDAELARQNVVGADASRLARIAADVLGGPGHPLPVGKRPDELNSTNDD